MVHELRFQRFIRNGCVCACLAPGMYVTLQHKQHFARRSMAFKTARRSEAPLLPFGSLGYRTDTRVLRSPEGGFVVLQLCLRHSCLAELQDQGIRFFTVRELLHPRLSGATLPETELSEAMLAASVGRDSLVPVRSRRWTLVGVARVLTPLLAGLLVLATVYGRLHVVRQAHAMLQERHVQLSRLAADYSHWKKLMAPVKAARHLELEVNVAVLLTAFAGHSGRLDAFSVQAGLIQADGSGVNPIAMASQLEAAGWRVTLNLGTQSVGQAGTTFSLIARSSGHE